MAPEEGGAPSSANDLPERGTDVRPKPIPRLARIALGLMTIWAVLYSFAALEMDLGVAENSGAALGPALQAVSILDVLVIFGAYAYIAVRSRRMRAIDKTGWMFAMLFLYPLVVPVFWYLHVWRTAKPTPSQGDATRLQ